MPDQISGAQFDFIYCGMVFVAVLISFLITFWLMKRDKLPPYDKE